MSFGRETRTGIHPHGNEGFTSSSLLSDEGTDFESRGRLSGRPTICPRGQIPWTYQYPRHGGRISASLRTPRLIPSPRAHRYHTYNRHSFPFAIMIQNAPHHPPEHRCQKHRREPETRRNILRPTIANLKLNLTAPHGFVVQSAGSIRVSQNSTSSNNLEAKISKALHIAPNQVEYSARMTITLSLKDTSTDIRA